MGFATSLFVVLAAGIFLAVCPISLHTEHVDVLGAASTSLQAAVHGDLLALPGETASFRATRFVPCSLSRALGRAYNLSVDLSAFGSCRLVVATALFGAQDVLRPHPPAAPGDGVCSFAFLDGCTSAALPLPPPGSDGCRMIRGWCAVLVSHNVKDLRVASRIFKLLLPRFFPHATHSLWCDGKSQMRVDPGSLLRLMLANSSDVGLISNPYRYSLYDEHKEVVRLQLADPASTWAQRDKYLQLGVPSFHGLIEGTLIARRHGSYAAHLLSCLWFNEYLTFPPRDQTSFGYIAHALRYRPSLSEQQFKAIKHMHEKLRHKAAYSLSSASFPSAVMNVLSWSQYKAHVTKHLHNSRHGACPSL